MQHSKEELIDMKLKTRSDLTSRTSDKNVVTIRIILIGDAGVGKTSIIQQLSIGSVPTEYHPTIGIEYTGKIISTDETIYKIQFWDTAGQERFRSIIRFYYRNVLGCIIVFDMTDRKSFENIKVWMDDYYLHRNAEHIQNTGLKDTIFICGNKCDLENNFAVTLEEVATFAKQCECKYYIVSAMNQKDVRMMIASMLEEITNIKNISLSFTKKDSLVVKEDGTHDIIPEKSIVPSMCHC